MSWFSENYEKAALGGAVLVAIGLSYGGLRSLGSVEELFGSTPDGKGPNDASVEKADEVLTATSSFEIEKKWVQAEDSGSRPVDLFTGVPLFVDRDNLKQPVDLPKSADVHPPIPNKWWIQYRIDPGFADSPSRDEDGDGFSNLEEYNGQTDPADKRKYPNLIQKLAYVGQESIEWVIRPSGYPSDQTPEPNMGFEYNDSERKSNRVGIAEPIAKGGLFFAEDPAKGRFKYLGTEKQVQRNERIQQDEVVWIVKIEDQKLNKKGKVYEIPDNFKRGDASKFSQYDRTAILSLEALGLNGQQFKVEENVVFGLPADAEQKRFKLIEVSAEQITVREALEDGTTRDHRIPKKN